jgi:NADH-quinone oxidoreductase subunit M
MLETDLLMMLLVIFIPSACAAVLLFFPRRAVEPMRWWALIGSAATLIVSLCILIDYYALLDSRLDENGRPLHASATRLEARADAALRADTSPVPRPRLSQDWVARLKWIERFDINFSIGIDGISLPLVLLTTIITFLAVLASWGIEKQVKGYLALLLLLETGVIGSFLALDLFLFFVFYEVMLLPMYFLIGLWGGGRRKYAAIKFVIYTLFGSVLILIAIIGLYRTDVRDFVDQQIVQARAEEAMRETTWMGAGRARATVTVHTFDMVTLTKAGRAAHLLLTGQEQRIAAAWAPEPDLGMAGGGGGLAASWIIARGGAPRENQVELLGRGTNPNWARERMADQPFFQKGYQYLFFLLLFVGFAVKVPIVPLHNWLPDAHVEAPTPISMVLAGILLKLGGYGIIRLAYPICPWAAEQLSLAVAIVGVVGIVYGALVAMGQSDFKKLLAYSSVSHMGYVILGIAAWSAGPSAQFWSWGMNGAMFQMVSHGITSAALFFVVGVVYERAHHRDLNRLGGLMEPMPLYGGMSAILFFASLGLPCLSGFVGELFVMLAAWNYSPTLAIAAILTTILTAGYLLWTWQRVFLGTNPATARYPDVSLREALVLLPFVLLTIALGVLPQIMLLNWMEPSVTGLVENLSRVGR